MYLLGDEKLSDQGIKSLGGKAKNLHLLKKAGFPVPAGLIISDAASDPDLTLIGGFPVAVRSSGVLEDLKDASFAGIYDSFLFIDNKQLLQKAIKDCFESLSSERVANYIKHKNIDSNELKMNVLIQKMIPAKIAGVLFTVNPVSGREEEFYLEMCQGVGERLVAGHTNPTRVVYDWHKDEIVSETINEENTKIESSCLKELIAIASKIQAYFGSPQDIEWAIDENNEIFILQSRPITSLQPRTDRPELTNADFKDGGVSARVCSPFMYSVYREAVKHSMGEYFKKINLIPNDEKIQWTYYHYGRVFWNAGAVKEGLKKIPGFNEEDFDRDLGIQKQYAEDGPHITALNVGSLTEAIPVLIGMQKEFRDSLNMIRLFREKFETLDKTLKRKLINLKHLNDKEFSHWFYEVILFQNMTEKNYFRTIYNNSNYQSEFKSFLKRLPRYEEGDEVDLMSELENVSHLDVQSGLCTLREISLKWGYESQAYHEARESFLQHHYHHGPAELDLMTPRWGEKKEWVDELVKSFVPTRRSAQNNYEKTFLKIGESLSIHKGWKFKRMLSHSRTFLKLREEMRSYSTRAYYLLRLGLLEFARRNSLNEIDAFMHDIYDIKRFLLNQNSKLPDIHIQKRMYDGYRDFVPPNEFGGTIQMSEMVSTDGLRGLGCSPGEFTGKARVILDIHATHDLKDDEILVTLFTDPGWTPVLARVGGVVTEVGGLLSHAAVIGREYGIPAVLNLSNATKLIKDGDLLKINGKTGIVEILEKCSKS